MSAELNLSAAARTKTGKGGARQLRRDGRIPAVLYGRGQEGRSLSVLSKDLRTILMSEAGDFSVIKLNIENEGGNEEKNVLLKEYQIDPVRRTLLHADFYEVDLKRVIQVEVPLNLLGTPAGVEKGGTVQQVRHQLLVSALPMELPSSIDVDISHLEMNEALHVSQVTPPSGVELIYDVDFAVATVVPPRSEESEVEAEADEAAAEGAGEE